ncbi:hypothetical protein JOC73_001518 [Alkaliphilus hydrothermalis]|uniref:Uncharacterized protein n=2 Tax=Alkaliphilus hydrothermalis TaxID=1482730 RepID=A0ABS2NPU2_9FIRM|nr:hypothetical protein [Alkaliphilus hydrothermalis]
MVINMKKVKRLLAITLVLTMLVVNTGIVAANSIIDTSNSNDGGYTTLGEPIPKRD